MKNSASFTALLSAAGCYQDKGDNRAMPEILFTDRGKLDWEDLSGTVIEKCEEAAKSKVSSGEPNEQM